MNESLYTSDGQDLRYIVQPYLNSGETVLWLGKPYTSVGIRPPFLTGLFVIFWCGFAIFWTVTASVGAGLIGLFGIPFVCVGVSMLYALFIARPKMLRNTVYAVTNRRALILRNRRKGTDCSEFVFSNLSDLHMENVKGNVGNICLKSENANTKYYNSRGFYSDASDNSFEMIDDVQRVYRIISEKVSEANKSQL